ncbi:hypothetical protein QBC35DRAFT_505048 [Podospora australis]|uniref:Uncharacterized protein n=1 Tax=Podospora australis TaxID=1536484 RepID=A0AAN7AGE0_9PEZI|nr:hypothetical protein QBC35DRAFT_505048 [Podospora australis]
MGMGEAGLVTDHLFWAALHALHLFCHWIGAIISYLFKGLGFSHWVGAFLATDWKDLYPLRARLRRFSFSVLFFFLYRGTGWVSVRSMGKVTERGLTGPSSVISQISRER